MARRERPIDPTVGPLPRFAYELRELRAAAGNPTYRAMARQAGFSATTLSEAAAGNRRPSLDVVLAFVGACDGDADEWRARWHRLEAVLREAEVARSDTGRSATPDGGSPPDDSPAASPGTAVGGGEDGTDGHVGPEVPDTGVQPAQPDGVTRAADDQADRHPGTRHWRRWHVVIAAAVSAAVVTAAFTMIQSATGETGRTPTAAATTGHPGCAAAPGTKDGHFTGTTYSRLTRIRDAARLEAPVLTTVPADCQLTFTGYCLGATVFDQTAGSPDIRWFQVAGGGVVASGVVHGNPPPGVGPSACPGSRPAPASIHLGATRQGTDWQLRATGTHVDIVGFAVRYPSDPSVPESAEWYQVAMTQLTDDGFTSVWRPGRLSVPLPVDTPVALAAVACLGGDGPTEIISMGRIGRTGFVGLPSPGLEPAERATAARAACRYPGG